MVLRLDRQGVSSILTMAFIILGTVIGVALLWAFVLKNTGRSGEVVDPDCLTINLELIDCKEYGSCNYAQGLGTYSAEILVKRGVGSGNLTGLRFIFESPSGFKGVYDRDLNPPEIKELENYQFENSYSIPVPVSGNPNTVSVAALIGKKKDVCPITSVPKQCPVITNPPPLGSKPGNRAYCCQQPPHPDQGCYNGEDEHFPLNFQGLLISEIMPPGNWTLCCESENS